MSIDSELRRRRKKKAYAQWRGRCFWCHERLTKKGIDIDAEMYYVESGQHPK